MNILKHELFTLEIVPEANDDDDNPTTWAIRMPDSNRNHFIWICKYDDKGYCIENADGYNLWKDKSFSTLNRALKVAYQICDRQFETGYFTD